MNKTKSAPKQLDYDKIAYDKLHKLGHRNIISQPTNEKYRNHYDLINWDDDNANEETGK